MGWPDWHPATSTSGIRPRHNSSSGPPRPTNRCCWSCLPMPIRWCARLACAACTASARTRRRALWSNCWTIRNRMSAPPCSSNWPSHPTRHSIAKISAYLKTETDPDLVVHGVRVLKAAAAPANLIELLHHPSWQVRAEAAEALGTLASPHNPNPQTADDLCRVDRSLVGRGSLRRQPCRARIAISKPAVGRRAHGQGRGRTSGDRRRR